MADNIIEKLGQQLFDETDRNKFSKLKDKLLKKYSTTDREKILEIFIEIFLNRQSEVLVSAHVYF